MKISGAQFERTSRNVYKAKTSFLRTTKNEHQFIIPCGGGPTIIPLHAVNFGNGEAIAYTAHARVGSVEPAEQVLSFTWKRSLNVTYTPPSDVELCEGSDTVVVSTRRRHSREKYSFTMPVLLT